MEYYESIKTPVLKGIYRVMVVIQRIIGYICAIALPLIIVYQVILRYILKIPLMGVEELMTFFIIWLYMMGGAVASEKRSHIECGILTLYIKKEKSMKIFNCIKGILSIVICAWLTYWAFWFFKYSFNLWKTSDILHIPMFIGESSMFIGLIFMMFFTLVELLDNIRDLLKFLKGGERK